MTRTRSWICAGVLWLFPTLGSPVDMADVPVITNLVLVPGSGPAGSQVVVRLHLFDRQGIGNIIPLLYEVREGIEESRVPIYDDGRHGDLLPNDDFFAGRMTIPLNLVAGPHWFVVFLFDRDGHRSNLLIDEFTVTGIRKTI